MTKPKSSTKKPTEKPNPRDYHWLSLTDMQMVIAQRTSAAKHMLKQKRRALGETQAAFGKRFGVGPMAVSRWETGKVKRLPQRVIEFVLPEVS